MCSVNTCTFFCEMHYGIGTQGHKWLCKGRNRAQSTQTNLKQWPNSHSVTRAVFGGGGLVAPPSSSLGLFCDLGNPGENNLVNSYFLNAWTPRPHNLVTCWVTKDAMILPTRHTLPCACSSFSSCSLCVHKRANDIEHCWVYARYVDWAREDAD